MRKPTKHTLTAARFEKARKNLQHFYISRAHSLQKQLGFGYIECENAPNDFESLMAAFKDSVTQRKALPVFSGASEGTIYPNKEGNWSFRFVHDVYHALGKHDFSLDGESIVAKMHVEEVSTFFGKDSIEAKLIRADTLGQVEYFAKTGEFPDVQLPYVMEYAGITIE